MLVGEELLENPREAGAFDYVIVGAGSAGCALAAALSDDASCRVLLIEAGKYYGRMDQHPEVLQRMDKYSFSLAPGQSFPARPRHDLHVWTFEGRLNPHLNATIVRGKVVGGSSAINGAGFTRGRPADYDPWAQAGNTEWSFEKVLPSFRAIETDLDFGDTALHGARGPVRVRRASREDLGLAPVLFEEAATAAGFASDPDMNGLSVSGLGIMPVNAVGAIRQNTGASFIDRVLARPNLSLLDRTQVRRVVFEKDRAVGLEIARRGAGYSVRGREIILCAGGINSPQLLMVSGVGPEDKLRAVGVRPVCAAPTLGANLADHPYVIWPYRLPEAALAAYGKQGGGLGLHYASGGGQEDICIFPYASPPPVYGEPGSTQLGLHCRLGAAESKGEIILRSASTQQTPIVSYNYVREAGDRRRFREAVRLAHEFLQHPAFRAAGAAVDAEAEALVGQDAALDHWIATHLYTAYHSTGTCRMGPDTDESAVVDQFCRVRGVRNLRVADASIIPFLSVRGVHATAIMIGERAAGLIRQTGPSA